MNTVIGQPPRPVIAWVAVMYTASTSGRSSRSTLIATRCSFISAAVAGSSNDSCAITWHQWHAEYPTESSTGTSRCRACSNASSDHGHQSTGLPACCSRYGLVASFSRFTASTYVRIALRRVGRGHRLDRDSQWRSLPVPLRHGGHRKRPADSQFRVVERDRYVLGRVVSPVDAVGDVRDLGDGLESVRAASGHVQRDLLVVAQIEAFPGAERRRRRPQVHDHVEDRAVGAPYELGLPMPAAHVQPADHTAFRAREAAL